jgi:hypothetical protein
MGAVIGFLAAQALLRLPDLGFHGLSSLVALIAVAPVLWSAYDRSRRSTRRLIRRGLLAAAVALGVVLAGSALAAVLAYPKLDDGVANMRAGEKQLEATDLARAAEAFDEAGDSFADAERAIGQPWAFPARFVPVLAQHVDTVRVASRSGRQLAASAAGTAEVAPYQQLRPRAGTVDLETIELMQEPVADSAASLRSAVDALDGTRSSWLVAPVSSTVDDFSGELTDALPEVELATAALDLAPELLGGAGTRRYLVIFTSPAESRSLGGFSGSYGLLVAEQGRVEFQRGGSVTDLARATDPATRSLPEFPGRAEYEAMYSRYQPTRFFQNLTVSPDFPTDAVVSAELYRQTTGQEVQGVIVADPVALAGFLELTGPVRVQGRAEPLTAETIVDYLLVDQYAEFPQANAVRRERLGDVAEATFDALTAR